jgi:hypothetical protein
MAFDYAEVLTDVVSLIADTGRVVTFAKLVPTAADAATPWKGPGEPTLGDSMDRAATFVPASGTGLGKALVSEELLKRAEQICLVAPADGTLVIEQCHVIIDGGVRWGIVWVETLRPGGTAVLYVVGVKR